MLPGLDGLSCLALLREHHPQATVVVLSGQDDDETIEKALLGGATAYMNKSINQADLPALLRQALLGNVQFAAPRIARDVVTQATRQSRYNDARGETGLTARPSSTSSRRWRAAPQTAPSGASCSSRIRR